MSRNKYPEETVQKTLDVSLRLFLEKGYEHTTVQDIIDGLGGLSKGAVYHHFKSKEEIFRAAIDHLFAQNPVDEWALIRDDPQMNAIEKLRALFVLTMQNPQETQFRTLGVVQTNVPGFLVARLKRSVEISARQYIAPILRQGMAEGSIQTAFPQEVAEVFMMLVNIWMDSSVFPCTGVDFMRKFAFLLDLFEKYGVSDFMTDDLSQVIQTNMQPYFEKMQTLQTEN